MKKLFIFDIDGTLVNSKRDVLPATILALQKAADAGHEIGVVSGRNYTQLDEVLISLPCIRFVGTINGGVVRDLTYDKQFIFAKPINRDIVHKFVEIAQRVKREFQCSNNEEFYRIYFGNDPKKDIHDPNFFIGGSKSVIYSDWELVKDRVLSGDFFHIAIKAEGSIIEQEFEELVKLYGETKEVNLVTASSCYIECDPYGISKDGAIRFLQELSGVDNANTYFFGDSGNDISALKYVGNGVVMGNAKSVIKQHAKYVIGDHDSDAIHDFVMNILKYE